MNDELLREDIVGLYFNTLAKKCSDMTEPHENIVESSVTLVVQFDMYIIPLSQLMLFMRNHSPPPKTIQKTESAPAQRKLYLDVYYGYD